MVSPVLENWRSSATAGGKTMENEVMVFGVSPEYFAITRRSLLSGRMVYPTHVDNRNGVCLIGTEIVKRLFDPTSSPLWGRSST